MGHQTMRCALPESMRETIDKRVAAGRHGNTREYIRDLVRRDQEAQANQRLRDLIEAGLVSGPGRRRAKADGKELLAIAGDCSRRDRLKAAVLRPQALGDQRGEVRYDRKQGGPRPRCEVPLPGLPRRRTRVGVQ